MATTATRRLKRHEHLRREILDAASAAFAEEGYEQLSMRKLAAQLGCAPGTLYLYFRDKDALLQAVVEESFAELFNTLRAIPETGDTLAWMKSKLRAYIEFGLRNPNHYKCAFVLQPARNGSRPYKPHPAFGELVNAVNRCVELGLLGASDVAATSQVIWACIHGLTSLLIARPNFPWVDKELLIDQLIDTAVAGMTHTRDAEGGHNGNRRRRTGK